MSRREIVFWPDLRLTRKCSTVRDFDKALETLIKDMFDTMYTAGGRGLAAPQIGEICAVFVMDETWKQGEPSPQVFVNPEILTQTGDMVTSEEGCLSIPGVTAEIKRPANVRVAWQNAKALRHDAMFSGFAATCIQHECDHLDGVVTLDRLDDQERARVLKAYAEPLA